MNQNAYKDNVNKIKQRSKRNDEIIREISERKQENLEKRKEIMHLRKLDQEENFTRSKNFHELYKLKLVEKILEKQERADSIKREQTRISNACAMTQAGKASRAFMAATNRQATVSKSLDKD